MGCPPNVSGLSHATSPFGMRNGAHTPYPQMSSLSWPQGQGGYSGRNSQGDPDVCVFASPEAGDSSVTDASFRSRTISREMRPGFRTFVPRYPICGFRGAMVTPFVRSTEHGSFYACGCVSTPPTWSGASRGGSGRWFLKRGPWEDPGVRAAAAGR